MKFKAGEAAAALHATFQPISCSSSYSDLFLAAWLEYIWFRTVAYQTWLQDVRKLKDLDTKKKSPVWDWHQLAQHCLSGIPIQPLPSEPKVYVFLANLSDFLLGPDPVLPQEKTGLGLWTTCYIAASLPVPTCSFQLLGGPKAGIRVLG